MRYMFLSKAASIHNQLNLFAPRRIIKKKSRFLSAKDLIIKLMKDIIEQKAANFHPYIYIY